MPIRSPLDYRGLVITMMSLANWTLDKLLASSIVQMFCMIYLLGSCGEHADRIALPAMPSLQVVFAPATQESLNVTQVRVTVEGSRRGHRRNLAFRLAQRK